MLICTVCGHVFEDGARRRSDTREHFGTPCHETEMICPNCGSDEIDDAARCGECGGYAVESNCAGGICPLCRLRLFGKIYDARKALLDKLSQAEREYIEDQLEGVIEI